MDSNNAFVQTEGEKLGYTWPAVAIGAFFGGPIAAGVLLGNNFKALDNPRAARVSLVMGFIVTGAFFLLMLRVQTDLMDILTNPLYPAGCMICALGLFELFQREDLAAFLDADEKKGSWGFVAGLSISSMVLSLLIALPIVVQKPPFEGSAHRLKASKGTVYFVRPTTRDEASILGEILETIKYFDASGPYAAAKLEKNDGGYNVTLEIGKPRWNTPQLRSWLHAIVVDLERFYGADVKITVVSYSFFGWNENRVFTRGDLE